MRDSFDSDLEQICEKWRKAKIPKIEILQHSYPRVVESELSSAEDFRKIKSRWSIDNMYTLISPSRCNRFFCSSNPIAPDGFLPNSVVRDRISLSHPFILSSSDEWKLRKISFKAEIDDGSDESLDDHVSSSHLTSPIDSLEYISAAVFKSKPSVAERDRLSEEEIVKSEPLSIENIIRELLKPDITEPRRQFFDVVAAKRLLAYRKKMRNKEASLSAVEASSTPEAKEEETNQLTKFEALLASIKPGVDILLSSDVSMLLRSQLRNDAFQRDLTSIDRKQNAVANKFISNKHFDLPRPIFSKYGSLDSLKFKTIGDFSNKKILRESTKIKIGGSSTIKTIGGSSTIKTIGGSSIIETRGSSSTIETIGGSSIIETRGGSSTFETRGGSTFETRGSSKVKATGVFSEVKTMENDLSKIKIMDSSKRILSVTDTSAQEFIFRDNLNLVSSKNELQEPAADHSSSNILKVRHDLLIVKRQIRYSFL